MTRAFWIFAIISASCGAEATAPAGAPDAAMLPDGAARPDAPVPRGTDAAVVGTDGPVARVDAGAVCGADVDLATDPQNCGTCGNACAVQAPSTVSCIASHCVEVLAHVTQPVALAQDATQLYWTDPASSVVDTIAKAGGAVTTLASGRPDPNSISIDGGQVYWAELADPTKTTQIGGVYSMSTTGTGATPTPIVTGVDYPYQMLATNGTVFYTEATGGAQPLEVERAGTSSTLWAPGVAAMTSRGGTLYWVTPATFDVEAANYFDADATLMSAPVAGGSATIIATGLTNTGGIAVDATYAYVTQPGTSASTVLGRGSIVRIDLVAGTRVVLATDFMQALAIAVDAANVYWVSFRDGDDNGGDTGFGSIRTVAIGGGTVTTLASAQIAPSGLVVDDTGVYWTVTDTYTGAIGSGAVLGILPK